MGGGMLFGKQKGRRSSALSAGFEGNDTWQSSAYGAADQGGEELEEEEVRFTIVHGNIYTDMCSCLYSHRSGVR